MWVIGGSLEGGPIKVHLKKRFIDLQSQGLQLHFLAKCLALERSTVCPPRGGLVQCPVPKSGSPQCLRPPDEQLGPPPQLPLVLLSPTQDFSHVCQGDAADVLFDDDADGCQSFENTLRKKIRL